jgi:hypothetical protein
LDVTHDEKKNKISHLPTAVLTLIKDCTFAVLPTGNIDRPTIRGIRELRGEWHRRLLEPGLQGVLPYNIATERLDFSMLECIQASARVKWPPMPFRKEKVEHATSRKNQLRSWTLALNGPAASEPLAA